jgi:hypothetical protein
LALAVALKQLKKVNYDKKLSYTLHFLIDVDSDFKSEVIENHLKSGRCAKVSFPFKSLKPVRSGMQQPSIFHSVIV